jgi:hypothetical protein
MSSVGLALAGTVPCAVGCCYTWMIVSSLVNALACGCVVLLSMLLFSLVVAVSTFGHSTVRRYNNTHCTYGVNLKHEGSISELHFAKSFFLARARTVHFFLQTIIWGCDAVTYACILLTDNQRERRGDLHAAGREFALLAILSRIRNYANEARLFC